MYFVVHRNTENTLDDYISSGKHKSRYAENGHKVNGSGIGSKIIAVHPYMCRAKPCGNLKTVGSHGILVKLPVIFEMHIGTVSCRVKSGPLRQGRFGYCNGADISFLFSRDGQDSGHGIVAMKAPGIQPDRLTDFGTGTEIREKIFADSDFIRLCRELSFYQLHLTAGNIHHVAVAVHIGGVVSLP